MTTLLYRLPLFTLLALSLAVTSVHANSRTAKKITAKTIARSAKVNADTRPNAKVIKTRLVAAKPRSNVQRVSDRVSVRKADTAVINYLAAPLSDRGLKSKRLGIKAAREAIERSWAITDTKLLSNNDPQDHPITGNATVVVQAQQAHRGMKLKREFIVNIGTDGKATVIGERSNALIIKFLRTVNEKLALTRIAQDIMHSSGVRKAATGLGVVAMALAAGHSGIAEIGAELVKQIEFMAPAIFTAAAFSAKNGLGRREQARIVAFEKLTATLELELKAGKSITLEGAYQRYSKALESVTIGDQITSKVKPPPREEFVKELTNWEVSRNMVGPE